jgi:hypothetical protein
MKEISIYGHETRCVPLRENVEMFQLPLLKNGAKEPKNYP